MPSCLVWFKVDSGQIISTARRSGKITLGVARGNRRKAGDYLLTGGHYTGIVITLLFFLLTGFYSVRLVRSASDFVIGGRRLGAMMVCGGIVGAFVGGTTTVGTAQMAYQYGLSGIWFALGAGFSCLLLSLFLAKPLREGEAETISRFLSVYYGAAVVPWVAVFMAVGMFIQMAVQMLAAAPMLSSILPLSPAAGLIVFAGCAALLVMGGGIMGAALVGFCKLLLLLLILLIAGVMSWDMLGGLGGIGLNICPCRLSLYPRGALTELAGTMSVTIGFISTQSFIQPVFASKDANTARLGSLLAAAVILIFGAAGVVVGLYMRSAYPGIDPAAALPLFLIFHQPPWLAGPGVATLLAALLLTTSSLALGVSTLISRDIYARFRPAAADSVQLMAARLLIPVVLAFAWVFSCNILGDLILDWTYLSNALRGVTVFLPLVGAVFISHRLSPAAGVRAVIFPPLAALIWAILRPYHIHPLYIGLLVSLLIMAAGLLPRK